MLHLLGLQWQMAGSAKDAALVGAGSPGFCWGNCWLQVGGRVAKAVTMVLGLLVVVVLVCCSHLTVIITINGCWGYNWRYCLTRRRFLSRGGMAYSIEMVMQDDICGGGNNTIDCWGGVNDVVTATKMEWTTIMAMMWWTTG